MENFKEAFENKREIKSCEKLNEEISELKNLNRVLSNKTYGIPGTLIEVKLLEELSELSKEVSKAIQNGGNYYNILEEIADVYICLGEFIKYYEISKSFIQKACDIKIEEANKKLRYDLTTFDYITSDNPTK